MISNRIVNETANLNPPPSEEVMIRKRGKTEKQQRRGIKS